MGPRSLRTGKGDFLGHGNTISPWVTKSGSENKTRPGHQRQDKRTAEAHALPVLRNMEEVNIVKDILRDALSKIDQIPSQSSQSGNPS